MSLEALATPVKATDITLLDKLIADGAIDQSKAAPLSSFIDLAESYNKAVSTPITRAEQDVTARMTMKASDIEITADSVMNTKAYVDPDKLKDAQMEITGTTTTRVTGSEPVVSNIKACYTGGVYYMDMGDGVKVKMTLDLFCRFATSRTSSSPAPTSPLLTMVRLSTARSTRFSPAMQAVSPRALRTPRSNSRIRPSP